MTQLLVSVRSVVEARAALDGGAAIIDVKEPARGSLGRADDDTLAAVVRFVTARRPVSAALGELVDDRAPSPVEGLRYVKWGLAGSAGLNWREKLQRAVGSDRMNAVGARSDRMNAVTTNSQAGCDPVAVVYADWRRAAAPRPQHIAAFAAENRWPVLLLDTWQKDGTTLFDWLSPADVSKLLCRCRAVGIRVALAGSLGLDHIDRVRHLQPDWLAVRGAVCHHGKRDQSIDPARIARLVKALATPSLTPASAED